MVIPIERVNTSETMYMSGQGTFYALVDTQLREAFLQQAVGRN